MRGIRFWWPWFSYECEECGHKTRQWRGLWYRPKHQDSELHSYIMGTPVYSAWRDIRDYEDAFRRAAERTSDDTTPN